MNRNSVDIPCEEFERMLASDADMSEEDLEKFNNHINTCLKHRSAKKEAEVLEQIIRGAFDSFEDEFYKVDKHIKSLVADAMIPIAAGFGGIPAKIVNSDGKETGGQGDWLLEIIEPPAILDGIRIEATFRWKGKQPPAAATLMTKSNAGNLETEGAIEGDTIHFEVYAFERQTCEPVIMLDKADWELVVVKSG